MPSGKRARAYWLADSSSTISDSGIDFHEVRKPISRYGRPNISLVFPYRQQHSCCERLH